MSDPGTPTEAAKPPARSIPEHEEDLASAALLTKGKGESGSI